MRRRTLPWLLLWLTGLALAAGTYGDFLAALALRESSSNAQSQNASGYLGLYQMGEAALIDAGYYRPDGSALNDWQGDWTGKDGVSSRSGFLANPDAQTNAVTAFNTVQWRYIQGLGLDRYVGQTVGGLMVTASGLLAGAHLVGVGGLQRYLISGGRVLPRDGNGTSIASYLATFGGYDVSRVTGSTVLGGTRYWVAGGAAAGDGRSAVEGAVVGLPGTDPEAAFATGAGVSLVDFRTAALGILSNALLLWTAWVAGAQYHGWRQGRLSLLDLQMRALRAAVITAAVLFITLS